MAEKSGAQLSYILKKDSIDALRQEVSALSLDHETRLYRPFVSQTVDYMKSQYGRFMTPQKKRQLNGLENRMFVADSHGFQTLYEEWSIQYDENGNRINEQLAQIEPGVGGFRLAQGGIMVLKDVSSRWPEIKPDIKELVRKSAKNEEDAKHLLASTIMANAIAHETIHNMHQDNS